MSKTYSVAVTFTLSDDADEQDHLALRDEIYIAVSNSSDFHMDIGEAILSGAS